MKYVFIMNPNSGSSRSIRKLTGKIKSAALRCGIDAEIYHTKGEGDAKRYTSRLCSEYKGKSEAVRIYGCGGDGTINEIVNGSIGYENVEIGAVPRGTGNDYIRNYGKVSDFKDIDCQISGKSVYSDAIKYRAIYNNKIMEGHCANMFNIGFDCNVVDLTSRIKRIPAVKGSFAYLLSVFVILIKKKGADLKIEYADGDIVDEKILLIAIANGCYCGGGVKGVPYCELDDGFMDVSVVRNVTRRFFVALFPSYAKGTHLEKKKMTERDIIRYSREKTLTVTANGESLRLCTDGEITTQKKIEFSIMPKAFRFIVPKLV